jgi:hypothetical protein
MLLFFSFIKLENSREEQVLFRSGGGVGTNGREDNAGKGIGG